MNHWLNKALILITIVLLIGCSKNSISFKGTSDEIMENHSSFHKNDLIEVIGQVAWIEYPKDGSRLNECAVSIKTKNTTDIIKKEGDVVCCKMKSRIDKNNVNKEIIIRGKFEKYIKSEESNCVYLRNCTLLQ